MSIEVKVGESVGKFLKGFIIGLLKRPGKRPIRVRWTQVRKGIINMSQELGTFHWKPDIILGVGRSGSVIASLLADNHRLLPPQTYLSTIDRDNPVEIHHDYTRQRIWLLNTTTTGKKVLLVDISLHTGGTLTNMIKYLSDKEKVEQIKVFLLFGNPKFSDRPLIEQYPNQYIGSYIVYKNPDDRQVLLPWHWTETAKRTYSSL